MIPKRLFFLSFILMSSLFAKTDFDIVKQRVIENILSASVDDAHVTTLVESLQPNGAWPNINYLDLSRTGFENRIHLANIKTMSVAYRSKESLFNKSDDLKKRINQSTQYWCDNDFICENWWYNQIYTPSELVTILLVMESDLKPKLREQVLPIIGRAHLEAGGARPGGDRMKIGGIAAKTQLATGNEKEFAHIMQVLAAEIKFSTGDRGMQHDYSFHHRVDRVNTTYSYGLGYANAFAEWAAFVAGTQYAFPEAKLQQLINYYLDGICKQSVYGIYSPEKGVVNRGISRKEHFSPSGTATPTRLMAATDYRKDELQEIINLRQGNSKPSASFCTFFWQTEHFVCQRPDFYTSVRMYSRRNRNMEWPHNSEGLKNHHRGDGTNYLSKRGDEYLNIWPVYDWQKIPGTTVLQKAGLPDANEIQKDGLTDFVGAVTDGVYGAVAFDFISPHDFITTKKAWFFFENEYVCLGAGIESNSNLPVVTTVNQALLNGDVVVSAQNAQTVLPQEDHKIENVNWVFHDGVGYLFPDSTTVHLSNTEKSGYWTDINKQSSSPKERVTKDVFALWINHGARPQGGRGGFQHASMLRKDVTYQYIVVPATSLGTMDKNPDIDILANNRSMQAVRHNGLGLVQIVFYQAGEIKLSEGFTIALDSPGIVMLQFDENHLTTLSIADPTRKLGKMHLTISGKIKSDEQSDWTAVYDSNSNTTEIAVNLPAGYYAGKSIVIEF